MRNLANFRVFRVSRNFPKMLRCNFLSSFFPIPCVVLAGDDLFTWPKGQQSYLFSANSSVKLCVFISYYFVGQVINFIHC